VLDLGCGTGLLTIPLAKIAKSVTALDISTEMLHRLRAKAEISNLHNIKYVNSSWQDAFAANQIESHDVIVSLGSYCRRLVVDADALRLPLPKGNESFLYES
jgi:2-polyprenyl-3-methyl-5-hydroxy-6-metoxy-1,4-benzoquinol methylase